MVITPRRLLHKKQQSRWLTWLSFGSAQPSKVARFSAGDNTSGQWWRVLVEPGALVDIDEVQAHSVVANAHFTRAGSPTAMSTHCMDFALPYD